MVLRLAARTRAAWLILPLLGAASASANAHAAEAGAEAGDAAPQILVVATPLGRDADPVADADTMRRTNAVSLADQLARTAPGVSINEVQGNPLQQDIAYRGFTASPLLGTPQGLSVWLDGVRINQPFGDVVSWDVIPLAAVRQVSVVSGAAPQFGRNALGGAVVLTTKDGRSDPGLRAEASGGSFGRITASVQAGGVTTGGFDWFAAVDHFREDGWRALSASRATRAFAKLGWSDARGDVALTGLYGRSTLNGNGLQDVRLLAADQASIYTAPDTTRNDSGMVTLTAHRTLSEGVTLSGNGFWRGSLARTLNGDINDDSLGQDLYQPDDEEQAALTAAGYHGFPLAGETQGNTAFPKWRCIAAIRLNSEPNEVCNGLLNASRTRQDEWGGSLELAVAGQIGAIEQRLTLGAAFVSSRADFGQTSRFGYLLPDRTVATVDGPGAFADGTQASDEAFDARVDLHARTTSLGLYALESAALTRTLRLDLAGRYDRTQVHNRDRITPGGGTGSLDSDPVYARFNPSAALSWQPGEGIDLALAWSQASRAPSAIELGCSDPASPCRLPNALAGDPPLRQVIAHTVELRAGLHGKRWSLGATLFRTDAADDILFVTDNPSGYGYFRNFGKTRRQGLELRGSVARGAFTLAASYTLLDATYRSGEVVGGSGNSSNDATEPGLDGSITIAPGDAIPLVPRHLGKVQLGWQATPALALSLDLTAASGVWARGNENNRHQPDGVHYLGAGRTDGYMVANLGGEWQVQRRARLFFTVRNLFDAAYATAAQLGATGFDQQGRFVAQPFAANAAGEHPLRSSTFVAPGAPRSFQAGVRLQF
ncbi:TonB-dependent receptor [Novosphingobium sp. FKTRR1]|uniref:TonB-dependent receptor n=1 Tax=Novosphingobium sp. FKTRR1 TaxID=2879118 RepID=UPI001CF07ACC|nr:TonB-dependent receptor [Novosphingobium sp. FKTRR1]